VFQGGPINVTVTPSSSASSSPPPVQVPVHYTGTGSNAASVAISPKTTSGLAGSSASFTAQALNASGQALAGTPIVFSSSAPAIASVPNASVGTVTLLARGSAWIRAQTLTGQSDSAQVTVSLPASQLSLVSGNGQTGNVSSALAQPIVAKVAASDGIGVSGVTVTFAAANGGSVNPSSAVSNASGLVQTTWTLGAAAGTQSLAVSSTGLSGSPVAVTATAQALTPVRLDVVTQPPASAAAGASLGSITVRAVDAGGNLTPAFTGSVSAALGTNPGSATLSGTTTVNAVNGVATFSDLSLNRVGSGYTLNFTASNLSPAASAGFAITAGTPAKLVFDPMPAAADAGIAIAPAVVVRATDQFGNATPSFAGAVTISIGSGPAGATLAGTVTRNAVNGVATFGDLSIAKSGTPYSLIATASGMTQGTSAAFSIAAGAPSVLALVSGGGQTANVGTTLPIPIVFQVRDALGNAIAGVTVNVAVTAGGGSVSAASGATDASGLRSVAWTLGASGGTQTITASASGLPSVAVNATATGAVLNHLFISTQPPATVTAGAPFTIVVVAKDASNTLLPSLVFSSSVSIASGPGGGLLTGTTASGGTGSITFNTLTLTKAGTYTLSVTSPSLTAATSNSFSVIANLGIPTADSGNAQSGTIGSALANPFVVKFADAYGNPTVGDTVHWTVTAGGGAMSAVTSLTDANGRARSTLTLGGTPGANSVVASITGNGNTQTFTATGTAITGYRVWTGAVDSLWSNAGNWSPALVPGATDSVQISSATNAPRIVSGSPVTVKHLQIFAGGDLRASDTLTIKGNLTANGMLMLRSGGKLMLAGAPVGYLQGAVVDNTGAAFSVRVDNGLGGCTEALNGNFSTTSDVLVTGYCTLAMNGHAMTIGRNFAVGGSSGTLDLSWSAADSLDIGGNFTSNPPSSYTYLSKGSIVVRGNLAANGVTIGNGTNRLIFAGAATQTVTQTGPSAVGLYNPIVSNAAGVVVADGAVLSGTIDLTGGPLTTANQVATSNGSLIITGTLHDPGTKFSVANPNFRGTTPLSATTPVLNVNTVTFDGTLQPYATQAGALTINGNMQTYQYYTVNGNTLVVTGNLTVLPYAKFNMTNALDSVDVTGNVTFQGIVSSLTSGKLVARGNYAQQSSTSLASFQASAAHTTILAGGGAQGVAFQSPDTSSSASCTFSCFGTLVIDKVGGSVAFNTAVKAAGKLRVINRTPVTFGGAAPAPRLIVIDSLIEPGDYSFWPGIATFGNNNSNPAWNYADSVTFVGGTGQNIDAGSYALVKIGGTPTVAGDFSTSGDLVVQGGGTLWPNGHTVTVGGTLSTIGTGVIKETGATDKIVAAAASFAGGSTSGLLTNGELEVDGSFAQLNTVSTSSYASTAPHKTSFGGSTALSISFAAPSVSYFGDLDFKQNGGGITFGSDVYAFGTLNHSAAMGQNLYSSGSTRLLSVTGLNQTGIYPLIFNNVALKYSDGTANSTFDNVTFTGFTPSPTGVTMFEFFRNSAGTYNFSNLTFTDLLAGIGRYIKVTGSQPLTLTSPTPTAANAMTVCGGTCTAWYTGAVTWP